MTSTIKVNTVKDTASTDIIKKCGTSITVGTASDTTTVPGNAVRSNAIQASDGQNIISQVGATITLGATGDNIVLAGGATQSGFGRTGTVDWQTTPKTATFTAVSGEGYFANTTGSAFNINLPAGVAGAIVSVADYAATFQTNNLTIVPNGTDKIGSINQNASLNTEGQSVTFVFVDSTQGWINTMDSTSNVRGSSFITATGGTITTVCTDYKVHTFTGPGTFCVSAGSGPLATVSYVVVAGGGGSVHDRGGGGGAGGFREGYNPGSYTASPLATTALPVSIQGYAVTIGAGGTADNSPPYNPGLGGNGGPSTFSTITSTGGGAGNRASPQNGDAGGSGGGAGTNPAVSPVAGTGGAGNSPSVSPPQGNPGGNSVDSPQRTGGGGGATAAGGNGGSPSSGGAGATSSINGTPTARAGGGGGTSGSSAGAGGGGAGGSDCSGAGGNGTTNTGGGGGGGASNTNGGLGGSGIVVIRYKFQ